MAGDPFGLLLRQRVVFLGGEVRCSPSSDSTDGFNCACGFGVMPFMAVTQHLVARATICEFASGFVSVKSSVPCTRGNMPSELQVNDFGADALISQLLLLDSQSPNKVPRSRPCLTICTRLLAGLKTRLSSLYFGAQAIFFTIAEVCAQDIKLFINSPGGSVTAGMGIYDAMQVWPCPVMTTAYAQHSMFRTGSRSSIQFC